MDVKSFTSASTIPSKIFCNYKLFYHATNENIFPVHIQVNPTNICPFSCSFCSCRNRDKGIEIEYERLIDITDKFIRIGTEACTITGGGDPLAYPRINDYVRYLAVKGIKVGLVTNAALFQIRGTDFIQHLTWCRISLSDEYQINPHIEEIVQTFPGVDWSFSYVITTDFNINNFTSAVLLANKYNFTHVRLVDDILSDSISIIPEIKKELGGIDDSRVIYQGRKIYTRGSKKCLISLLKPNIGPDGNVYPCCGIQYARSRPSLDLLPEDMLCTSDSINATWRWQLGFDGSGCEKCYYSDYNNILNLMQDSLHLKHKEFV